MKKLSDIVASIPEHFEVGRGSLYEKSDNPEKKCTVCALGGIALLGAPERFVINDDGELFDKQTHTKSIDINYSDILEALKIPSTLPNHGVFEFIYISKKGVETQISQTNLYDLIWRINDTATNPIKAVTAALRKYGL